MVRDLHQLRLMEAARVRGIEVQDLAPQLGLDVVAYSQDDRTARVRSGRVFPHLNAVAERLCDDKHATKAVLSSVGVPVPGGRPFQRLTEVEDLLDGRALWVLKPRIGTHGDGVRMGLRTRQEVAAALHPPLGPDWLLEEQIEGADLRIQAIGGRLVAACRREPARVVGDGHSTVEALVAAERERVRAANPQNDLSVDTEALALLAAEGLDLYSVPAKGQVVWLRRTANMATGGRAVDLTPSLHPGWATLTQWVAEALDISVFAIDAVTPDPEGPPRLGAVIEVNARPEWLHHSFASAGGHDIAGLLLDDLFS